MKQVISAIALLIISTLSLQGLKAQTFAPDYLDGHIYLKLEDTSTVDLDPYNNNILALNTIFSTFGVDTIYQAFRTQDPLVDKIYRLEFTDLLNTGLLISQLQALLFIDYAEQVPLIETTGTTYLPNDLDAAQYALDKINAQSAWDVSQGSPTVTVAIVDNAISTTHEDLQNVIWTNPGEVAGNLIDDDFNGYIDDVNGYDVANLDPNANPPAGINASSSWNHGTHCAGIAGAETDKWNRHRFHRLQPAHHSGKGFPRRDRRGNT